MLSGAIDIADSIDSTSLSGETAPPDEPVTQTLEISDTVTIAAEESPLSEQASSTRSIENISDRLVQGNHDDQLTLGYEPSQPIDQTDRSDVLAVIRRVFSDGQPRTRENAIREVARALGYGRVGHRINDVLQTDLLTAVRRGILDNVEDELILLARSIVGYDRDFLKQQFLASIGRSWIERDDAMQNFCRWMGFRRTGQIINETARSLIQGLLRESRLEADGPKLIRRSP